MKLKFKITGPGQYLTRDGREAIITGPNSTGSYMLSHPWLGYIKGESNGSLRITRTWATQGNWDRADTMERSDLVARIQIKPKQLNIAQYGVWIPCKTRKQARQRRNDAKNAQQSLGGAVVRKIML